MFQEYMCQIFNTELFAFLSYTTSPSQKRVHYMISFLKNSRKCKLILKDRKQISGCPGLGEEEMPR